MASKVCALAVVRVGVLVVLAYAGAIEIDTGEEAFGAGVGEQFGVHFPVGGSLSVTAHRARGGGGIGADLEFVLEQVLEAPIVDRNQDQVSGLRAD